MAIEITVPRLGWSMEEGTFVQWLKNDGELVRPGEMLFVLEGDKASQEIECFDEGHLRLLPGGPQPGDTVTVGQVLGHLLAVGESAPFAPPASPVLAAPGKSEHRAQPQTIAESSAVVRHPQAILPHPEASESPIATPRARRRAAELAVDWKQLKGSGSGGRVRERDVLAASSAGKQSPSVLRRTIAQRMVASCRTTAPVTLTTTADVTNLLVLRQQFKFAATTADAIVPSITDCLMKLTASALQSHPSLNARWDEDGITTFAEIHIGLAVDSEAGLLVPVIRRVDQLSLRELALQSRHLIELARARKLPSAEMEGGTFTITSLGAYGIDAFTPIINGGQSAILGIGRFQKQPVFIDGQFVPRDVMTLSLTFDHRLVDGAPAARFLQSLVQAIETPSPHLTEPI